MEKDVKSVKSEIRDICWHMRGGITWQEAWNLASEDRQLIYEMIKEHLETTKKTGLPYF